MGVRSHGLVLTRVAMWGRFTTLQAFNQSQQQQLKPTKVLPLPRQVMLFGVLPTATWLLLISTTCPKELKLHIELIQSCLLSGVSSIITKPRVRPSRSGATSRSGRQFERGWGTGLQKMTDRRGLTGCRDPGGGGNPLSVFQGKLLGE